MPDLVVISPSSIAADSPPPFVSFAMPAFNEENNIERTVSECQSAFVSAGLTVEPLKAGATGSRWGEIVVTNDCSRDRTGEILARMQTSIPNLVVVTHLEKNQGYGRALSDAIAATRGQWIATIDSDGQFDPADLPRLLALARDNLDLVAGYRMRKKDSLTRVIADRGLNFIVRALFGIRHRDTNCAFKLVRGDVLRGLSIETNGFQTPTEIVLKLHALGHKMVETGVTHRVREEGKSKLKVIKTSLDFLRYLFYLRTKITLYKKRILARL